MSRPMGMTGRATSTREKRSSVSTFFSPAASAMRVLPVPALPTRVTRETESSSSSLKAMCCCTLSGLMALTE